MISSTTPEYDAHTHHDNLYSTLLIGLHVRLLNLTPLFTHTWFSDAFYSGTFFMFGHACYILRHCGIHFLTCLVLQTIITLHIKLYNAISIKYNSRQKITLLSSIAHGFLDILTAEMVNELNIARPKRPLHPFKVHYFPFQLKLKTHWMSLPSIQMIQ